MTTCSLSEWLPESAASYMMNSLWIYCTDFRIRSTIMNSPTFLPFFAPMAFRWKKCARCTSMALTPCETYKPNKLEGGFSNSRQAFHKTWDVIFHWGVCFVTQRCARVSCISMQPCLPLDSLFCSGWAIFCFHSMEKHTLDLSLFQSFIVYYNMHSCIRFSTRRSHFHFVSTMQMCSFEPSM